MKTAKAAARRRFVLGIDFGTLSGRALLVDVESGKEAASATHEYAGGVMSEHLPGSARKLPPQTALQNPADYLETLRKAVPKALRAAGISGEQVAGIGTDFTCCTILPARRDGKPLCFQPKWKKNPHAWVKLWKHHSPQPEADFINTVARQRQEKFLQTYGGKYSSEWFFSKVLETVREAPEVYEAADRFVEAGDWIVWQLCGAERRNLSAAGFKAMWEEGAGDNGGYPSREFFKELHPRLERVVESKLDGRPWPLGSCAGGLTPEMAREMGLLPGTPVAVGNIDAHAAVPACGVTVPGKMVMILGTSTCHLLLAEARQNVEGICGVVRNGVAAGFFGYEAGQPGVGDCFAWFVENAVPARCERQARQAGVDLHQFLEKQAAALKPGEHGLLALDWWNGNRSVLVDASLAGLLLGATVHTRPHEIYRALIEATAFGTRKIIEAFVQKGVAIDELYACGGLAQKNELLMQIYSDITGRPIRLAASEQASALGAAMHGAVAAGVFPNIAEAARRMTRVSRRVFRPEPKAMKIYDSLYAEYARLHDLFGRRQDSTMRVLRRIQAAARHTES